MINRIKEAIGTFITGGEEEKEEPKLVIIDPATLQAAVAEEEPDSYLFGLFAEVVEDKIAELVHALLVVTEEIKKKVSFLNERTVCIYKVLLLLF